MRVLAIRNRQGRSAARGIAPPIAAPRLAEAAAPVRRLVGAAPAPLQIQRAVDPRSDPTRFETLHQNLFVNAPTTTGGTRQPWVAGTTDVQIKKEFKSSVQQQVEGKPLSLVGTMAQVT